MSTHDVPVQRNALSSTEGNTVAPPEQHNAVVKSRKQSSSSEQSVDQSHSVNGDGSQHTEEREASQSQLQSDQTSQASEAGASSTSATSGDVDQLTDSMQRASIGAEGDDNWHPIVEKFRVTEYPQGRLVLEVEESLVGRIIGRGGSSLHALQDKTNTRINVLPHSKEGKERPGHRHLEILGQHGQVEHCSALIQLKIVPRRFTSIIHRLRQTVQRYEPMWQIAMAVPMAHIGRIIGKKGQAIRQLQALSGTQIYLPKDGAMSDYVRHIQITGNPAACQYCYQLLLMRTISRDEGGLAGPGPVPMGTTPTGESFVRIHLLDEAVGGLIGKGGQHIKSIQNNCGAHIRLSKDCIPGTWVRELHMSGTSESVTQGLALLENQIEAPAKDVEPFLIIPPSWPDFFNPSDACVTASQPPMVPVMPPGAGGYYAQPPASAQSFVPPGMMSPMYQPMPGMDPGQVTRFGAPPMVGAAPVMPAYMQGMASAAGPMPPPYMPEAPQYGGWQ